MEINDINKERKEKIKAYIYSKNYIPLKRHEIRLMLDVPPEDAPVFEDMITELIKEGSVVETKKGKLMATKKMNIYTGIFNGTQKGYGFVKVESLENDIFIPADYTYGALNKDTVLVKITKQSHDGLRSEGEIIRIIEKGSDEIVGTFQSVKSFGFVIPDDKKISQDIFIPAGKTKGAVDGHKVVAKITKRSVGNTNPEGVITEIIGHINDPGVDILSVIKQFDLPESFPEDVMKQIESIDPDKIDERLVEGRDVYRDIL